MKFSLKSFFPSTLFNKITLKAAILVGLILFYLVIMLSSSREGLETTAPQSMGDVQQMIDQVTKKPSTETATPTDMATPTESTDMSTPTESATPTEPTPTKANTTKPAVETMASPSKTPYSTY
jgi:cytoskeletal protein RodZ